MNSKFRLRAFLFAWPLLIVEVFPFFDAYFDYSLVRYFLPIFVILLAVSASAQQFRFDNYSVNAGLPQSQVYCQIQDQNGFLWMGTMGGGIAKFDGRNFTNYTTRNGLPNNFVHCVFLYKDTLWVGTQKGLAYHNNHGVFRQNEDNLAEQQIISIFKDENVTLIGTASGVYLSDKGSKFVNITANFGIEKSFIATIFKDVSGTYWIGGSQGVLKYQHHQKKYQRFTMANGLGTNDVECFTQLKDSTLLIGTYGRGVYRLKNDEISSFRIKRYIGDEIVHDFYMDEKLWIGTQGNGLFVVDLATLEVDQITQRDGLANNHVRSILKDNWGTYWIGTSGGGVSKYFGQSFIHYTNKKGLPGNYIYSIYQKKNQEIWMGVSDKGLVKKDSSGFVVYGRDSGFVDTKVKAIEEDDLGRLWLGTVGNGIYTYDGTSFTALPRRNGLLGRFIKDLEWDGNAMWSATIDEGIFRINTRKGKQFTQQFSLENGVQSDRINSLCMVEGKMWYGCQSKGVGYIQKNTVTDLSKKGFPEWAVRAMKADDKGNIWVATGGSGLARIYQDKSTSSGYSYKLYGYENGMLSTNIYLVYAIDNKVYCGSENGIDELTLNDQYDVIEAQHYGYDEGFVGVETCQDAVMNDDQGNLWFGTINGLSHFKPNQNATNALTPMVSFTDVRANLSPLAWMGDNTELYLKHFQNTVSFEFVGIDLARPKSVIYSYRLRGNDTTWSVGGPLNSVQFSNLKPGGYKFQVKASSDGKTWSPVRTFGFSISTPFWKTWWFWTLCIVGIALIIWFWFRYRIKNLEQKAEEEKLKYQMKNELLQLEQKALRLQMNPHFLFNALNSIQGLIIKNDQKSARYYLAKFAHLMRQILDNSRNAIISLDEEIKTLENYLLIEKLSKKDTFIYELKVDEEINQATLQIPPMLIQPFIENAIIHAFTGMDKEGKVNINIYRDNALLVVEIIDNGIGRKKAGEISKKGINRPSVGIEVTEQRLNANNEGTASEAVKIVDLQDEDGNPTGTMVVLKIKID